MSITYIQVASHAMIYDHLLSYLHRLHLLSQRRIAEPMVALPSEEDAKDRNAEQPRIPRDIDAHWTWSQWHMYVFYNNNACQIFHCAVSSFVDWKHAQVLGNGKKRRRTLPCNELCHGSISGKQPTQTELHGMRWDAIFVQNGDWNFEDDKLPSNM